MDDQKRASQEEDARYKHVREVWNSINPEDLFTIIDQECWNAFKRDVSEYNRKLSKECDMQ